MVDNCQPLYFKTMEKKFAEFKPNEIEYVKWTDNYSEMKIFCEDKCEITYEYAKGLDCFFNLKLQDGIRNTMVTIPFNHYVIKLSDHLFTWVNPQNFEKYFTKTSHNK